MKFFECAEALLSAEYKFAKTMPQFPHYYTLRENWNDELFSQTVKYIRENGKREKFGSVYYTYFYLNGYKYWTMGAPIEKTILTYDMIAKHYQRLFSEERWIREEEDL